MNDGDMFRQFGFKDRVKVLGSTNPFKMTKSVRCTILRCKCFTHSTVVNRPQQNVPVRQYAFVSAANTPISFEFSKAQRVAIVRIFIFSGCAIAIWEVDLLTSVGMDCNVLFCCSEDDAVMKGSVCLASLWHLVRVSLLFRDTNGPKLGFGAHDLDRKLARYVHSPSNEVDSYE
jgi:hypothetical protein